MTRKEDRRIFDAMHRVADYKTAGAKLEEMVELLKAARIPQEDIDLHVALWRSNDG